MYVYPVRYESVNTRRRMIFHLFLRKKRKHVARRKRERKRGGGRGKKTDIQYIHFDLKRKAAPADAQKAHTHLIHGR